MLGTIKFYNREKAYGFVLDEQNREYYFSTKDLAEPMALEPDERVLFTPREGNKGLTAFAIQPHLTEQATQLIEEVAKWKAEAKLEDSLATSITLVKLQKLRMARSATSLGVRVLAKQRCVNIYSAKLRWMFFAKNSVLRISPCGSYTVTTTRVSHHRISS